jgi:hypothetical protein
MISAYLVLAIYAMSIDLFFYYLSLLAEEAASFHCDSAVDHSKHCILARQGKKKAMAGSKAATQQDRISGPPQQVYVPPLLRCTYNCVYMPIPVVCLKDMFRVQEAPTTTLYIGLYVF